MVNRHQPPVAFAVALLLAGCSGSANGGAATSATSSTSSPSASSPSTPSAAPSTTSSSSSSSNTKPAGDPNVPAAARAHTKTGAEAFVRTYLERINEVGQQPVAGRISALGTAGCKSCDNYEQAILKMLRAKQHYSGPIFKILRLESSTREQRPDATIDADVAQLPIKVFAADGSVARRVARASASLKFNLVWHSNRWFVERTYFTALNQP